ncbi:alpha/beta fold hydrolase [Streptomyces katrae]|uniref:alpha/beta fold hydrolase n=1 Tax=Streptomyces katrae TaxID=68223 RepID=UPI003CCBE5B3
MPTACSPRRPATRTSASAIWPRRSSWSTRLGMPWYLHRPGRQLHGTAVPPTWYGRTTKNGLCNGGAAVPENRTRVRRDVGRYVNDELRDRYFAAADVLYAMGAPIRSEADVETSFGTTHVYRYGPADPAAGSRTPIVLIHGAGYSSAMWHPNTPGLSLDRPVYALDTPGDANRSIHREPMWQPERAAQWMDEALGALGLDRVHLVGSSYGGWLVLNQAHRRPGRLASVTALDPGGLEKVGLRFFAWVFVSLFASFAGPGQPRDAQVGPTGRPRLPDPPPRTPAALRGRAALHPHPALRHHGQAQPARAPEAPAGPGAPAGPRSPRRDRHGHGPRPPDRPPGRGQRPHAGLHGRHRHPGPHRRLTRCRAHPVEPQPPLFSSGLGRSGSTPVYAHGCMAAAVIHFLGWRP